MIDMLKVSAPKTDQQNADCFPIPRTVKITAVKLCDSAEQPIAIHFEGDEGRPYKPCRSMRRVMIRVWGVDGHQYVGRSMTLFCDPSVAFGGEKVGGIRISHMSGIDEPVTMPLTVTRAKRKPYTVKPLQSAPVPSAGRSADAGEVASVADAASLIDAIDRCETAHELSHWNLTNKAAYSKLEGAQFEMVGAAYKRRKAEIMEAAASL